MKHISFRYRPLKRGEDREKMKDKLANTMAYGDNQEQTVQVVTTGPKKQAPKLPSTKEVWHDCKDSVIQISGTYCFYFPFNILSDSLRF